MGFGIIRIQLNCFVEAVKGCIDVSLFLERIAQVVMRFWVVGPEFYRLAVSCNGSAEVTLLLERDSKVVVGFCNAGSSSMALL
jgi:hypothetical protein